MSTIGKYSRAVLVTAYLRFTGKLKNFKKGNINSKEGDPLLPFLTRKAAAEGAILLKNENDLLPLPRDTKIALFGRCQIDCFFHGFGSGGDVLAPYKTSIAKALGNQQKIIADGELMGYYQKFSRKNKAKNGLWGLWRGNHPEAPISEQAIINARARNDVAAIVIGRGAGEDHDFMLKAGNYYLTKREKALIRNVTMHFDKVIVLLNISNTIDLSWAKDNKKISSLMILHNGGMEAGNACVDLLTGVANPSGKLTETIAKAYNDYPSSGFFGGKMFNNYEEDIYVGYRFFETFATSKVLYPFGFGLSYTRFNIVYKDAIKEEDKITFTISVRNIGAYSGREVVQIYAQKPCGDIGNPYRVLVGFQKTRDLKPRESDEITITVPLSVLSSYDEKKASYVMLDGDYLFSFGNNVHDAINAYTFHQKHLEVLSAVVNCCMPSESFKIIKGTFDGGYIRSKQTVSTRRYSVKDRIEARKVTAIAETGNKNIKLIDVKNKVKTLDEFIAQLSLGDLIQLSQGEGSMDSKLGPKGNAGCFGGVTDRLRGFGIPVITTTDGPSGIRLSDVTSLLPSATCLASTFDEELLEDIYTRVSKEMKQRGSDVLLAPGVNIKRNPLCGRNFEYLSEDPVATGILAKAIIRGIQKGQGTACIKHFACNNQENNRHHNDSRVSERALREIYLKGFQIALEEDCLNVMTSYNKINGVWGHYHYELCQSILRDEWGYKGNIMTDWWMINGKSLEYKKLYNNGYRLKSGVNLLMPGKVMFQVRKDRSITNAIKENILTLGELQENARWILASILRMM